MYLHAKLSQPGAEISHFGSFYIRLDKNIIANANT